MCHTFSIYNILGELKMASSSFDEIRLGPFKSAPGYRRLHGVVPLIAFQSRTRDAQTKGEQRFTKKHKQIRQISIELHVS